MSAGECGQAGTGNRAQRGFTLLELLAGLAVFSLLVVVLYSGFRVGTRSWEAGAYGADTMSELRLAAAFLHRQLGKAVPLAINDGREWRIWFEGDRDRLVFLVDIAPHLGQGGLYEMTLFADSVDGGQLTVARRSLRDSPSEASDNRYDRPRPLVEDLVAAEFAYFGSLENGLEPDWHSSWQSAARLPLLVRVRLTTRSAGQWPDLIVRVNADGTRYQRVVGGNEQRTRRDDRIHRKRSFR